MISADGGTHSGCRGEQLFLYLMNRSLHEIFSELGPDGLAQGRGIHLAKHAEGARGGNHDQALRLAFCDRDVQSARQRGEKRTLRKIMPIRLFDRAAGRTHRRMRLAGTIGTLIAGARLGVLTHLLGVEIRKPSIADILKEKSLAAIAHDHPISGLDVDLVHRIAPAGISEPDDVTRRSAAIT